MNDAKDDDDDGDDVGCYCEADSYYDDTNNEDNKSDNYNNDDTNNNNIYVNDSNVDDDKSEDADAEKYFAHCTTKIKNNIIAKIKILWSSLVPVVHCNKGFDLKRA